MDNSLDLELQLSAQKGRELDRVALGSTSKLRRQARHRNISTDNNLRVMDSPLVNRIFRRLFAHETCSTLRFSRQRPRCVGAAAQYTHANGQRRTILGLPPPEKKSTRYSKKIDAGDEVWEQRAVLWQYDKTKDFEEAPLVTAEELAKRRQRPTNVKMLMRDFIDGESRHCPIELLPDRQRWDGHVIRRKMLIATFRQPLQSALRLLSQGGRHLLSRYTL